MRSSRSIQLLFLGSALALLGCGANEQAAAKRPCPPRPDGTPDPNCAGNNNNRSNVRTGGFVFLGGGSSSSPSAARSAVVTSPGGVRTGGFGSTGGARSSVAS